MTEHTQEPWTMGKGPLHENEIFGVDRVDGSRQLVARVYGYSAEEVRANMRRITACVKACQDIPTGALEAGVVVVPVDVVYTTACLLRKITDQDGLTHYDRQAATDLANELDSVLSRLRQNGGEEQ